MSVAEADQALDELLSELADTAYRFIAVTPETHRRVVAKRAQASDLRDVLGWSLPFQQDILSSRLFDLLSRADALQAEGQSYRSKVRVASIDDALFLHSSYPTSEADSVFFGPDTYRFAAFLRRELPSQTSARHVVDIGSGSGAGAIVAATILPSAKVVATDINPRALRLARVNARHNRTSIETIETAGLDDVLGSIDVVISNPPFIDDGGDRLYRDGGDMHGGALSLDWAKAAVGKLAPGGRMLLYSGSAIVAGKDRLRAALGELTDETNCSLAYNEIDPDIFGEQLDSPQYRGVERIAAIGAVITRR